MYPRLVRFTYMQCKLILRKRLRCLVAAYSSQSCLVNNTHMQISKTLATDITSDRTLGFQHIANSTSIYA